MSNNGINLGNIANSVGSSANKAIGDVNDLVNSKDFDPSNPQDMVSMQMKMMKMNMLVQFESQMVKSVDDMVKGILQRMN